MMVAVDFWAAMVIWVSATTLFAVGPKSPGRQSKDRSGWTRHLLPAILMTASAAVCVLLFGAHSRLTTAIALLPVIGWLVKVFLVRTERARKTEMIRRDLPSLIDSLVLLVESGNSLIPAMLDSRRVLSGESPLKRTIDQLEMDLQCGLSQVEALEKMDRSVSQFTESSAIGTIAQSLRMGSPIGNVLREQSSRMRENLILEGEHFANTLSVKLLIPLLFFIFPASFLVILSPVIVALLETTTR